MSLLKRLRKKIGYEDNIPRCPSCKYYKQPKFYSTMTAKRLSPASCKAFAINVTPNSICDMWTSKKGITLDSYNKDLEIEMTKEKP